MSQAVPVTSSPPSSPSGQGKSAPASGSAHRAHTTAQNFTTHLQTATDRSGSQPAGGDSQRSGTTQPHTGRTSQSGDVLQDARKDSRDTSGHAAEGLGVLSVLSGQVLAQLLASAGGQAGSGKEQSGARSAAVTRGAAQVGDQAGIDQGQGKVQGTKQQGPLGNSGTQTTGRPAKDAAGVLQGSGKESGQGQLPGQAAEAKQATVKLHALQGRQGRADVQSAQGASQKSTPVPPGGRHGQTGQSVLQAGLQGESDGSSQAAAGPKNASPANGLVQAQVQAANGGAQDAQSRSSGDGKSVQGHGRAPWAQQEGSLTADGLTKAQIAPAQGGAQTGSTGSGSQGTANGRVIFQAAHSAALSGHGQPGTQDSGGHPDTGGSRFGGKSDGMTNAAGFADHAAQAGRSGQTAPQTRSAPPSPAFETQVMEQVKVRFQSGIRAGHTEMVVRMHPPELGEVRLNLLSSDGALKAHLHVQSQQVHDILERHAPQLRDALAQQGIDLDDVVVSSEGGDARDNSPGWERGQHSRKKGQQNPRVSRTEGSGSREPLTPVQSRLNPMGGALSLRI